MNAWPTFEDTSYSSGLERWDDREKELRKRISKDLDDEEEEAVCRWGVPIDCYLPNPGMCLTTNSQPFAYSKHHLR